MRSDANQLRIPLDAPLNVLLACKSEARAVQICLRVARERYGRTQEQVALLCGWKSDTCLSEIAKESNSRRMPMTRRERFALATGCNLLNQYLEREEIERRTKGRPTERDEVESATDLCIASWGMAA